MGAILGTLTPSPLFWALGNAGAARGLRNFAAGGRGPGKRGLWRKIKDRGLWALAEALIEARGADSAQVFQLKGRTAAVGPAKYQVETEHCAENA
eukprot:7758169-Alexandrium_andersonii.AAC.1